MCVLQFTPTIRVPGEMCFYNSELQLERELDRARAADLVQRVQAPVGAAGPQTVPQCLRRVAELGTREISDLGTEVRVVEDIEELSPEAKLRLFCQAK